MQFKKIFLLFNRLNKFIKELYITLYKKRTYYKNIVNRLTKVMFMKKATIKDVAQLAEVSTATVSNVMNNSKFVQKVTKDKVLRAMDMLNYQPSNLAKSLKGMDSKVIGLIIPSQEQDTSADFFTILASGVEKTLQECGYQLIIANSHEEYSKEKRRMELFNTNMIDYVDGIIIAPTSGFLTNMTQFFTTNLPVVFADRQPGSIQEHDVVYTNNYTITLEVLEHIVNNGYEDLLFVSGPIDVSSTIERSTAFEKIFYKLKGNQTPKKFETTSSFEAGYKLGEAVVSSFEDKKRAIFFSNNTIAMGMIKYFNDKGIEIPKDVGVVIYDDYPWMEITKVPLTSIKQPAFEMGVYAAKLLLDKIKNKHHVTQRIEVPSKIIYRKSL